MQKYKSNIITTTGLAQRNVSVRVLDDNGALAPLYADRYGQTPIANPQVTAVDGTFAFYAANGRYSLQTTINGVTYTDQDVVLAADPEDMLVAGPIADAVNNATASVLATATNAASAAQASQNAAAASQGAAAASESNAAGSASAAAGSAATASGAAGAAATSETNAHASENAAATSAGDAATSESNALASKNAAATAAANAATYAQGYANGGVYGAGITLNDRFTFVAKDNELYRLADAVALPYTTIGDWASESNKFVSIGDRNLRQELASTATPGGALVALPTGQRADESVPFVATIAALRGIRPDGMRAGKTVSVIVGCHTTDGDAGGGRFAWDGASTAADDDGVTIGSGPAGRWVRVVDDVVYAAWFGIVLGHTVDNAAALSAALKLAITRNAELVLPDGLFHIASVVSLQASVDGFMNVRIRGTFASTGAALSANPEVLGTVIHTDGTPAFSFTLDTWNAENVVIRGVGFYDASAFPAGGAKSVSPAIVYRHGDVSGTPTRYNSGNIFEDVAACSYSALVEFIGLTPDTVPNAAALNYIGPTSFVRAGVELCTRALMLADCTLNHLWVNESTWHSLDSSAIALLQTSGGSGGNVCATLSNMVMEGLRGFINTSGGITGANAIRNKLVLNSVNREFCGLYGPTEPNGFYSGSPLGYCGNTDVYINGVWTESVAYGEIGLPEIDPDMALFASAMAQCKPSNKIISRTPHTINRSFYDGAVPANDEINLVVNGGDGYFYIDLTILLGNGQAGILKVVSCGNTSGAKYRTIVANTLAAGITITLSDGTAGSCMGINISNVTTFVIGVQISCQSLDCGRVSIA